MALAQRLQKLAGEIEAQHLMRIAVGHQDRAVGRGVQIVRFGELALAPASQELAVAAEHQHRPVGAALGHVHPPLAVDHQVGQEAEALARRQPRPLAMDGVASVAQDHGIAFVGHLPPSPRACKFGASWGLSDRSTDPHKGRPKLK